MNVTEEQIEKALVAFDKAYLLHQQRSLRNSEPTKDFDSIVDWHTGRHDAMRAALTAALSMPEQEGWKLVPVEPTNKMLMRCQVHQAAAGFDPDAAEWLRDIWSDMLAAAPLPAPHPLKEDDRG